MRIASTYLALLAVLLSPMVATADPILYAPNSVLSQVDFFEPIGQTFIAEDELVEAGLWFEAINPSFSNSDDVLYQLFAGAGIGGILVASEQFSLANAFYDFFLVDFSSVSLIVGNTYSLVASIVGTSPYWGVHGTNDASAGSGIIDGELKGRVALFVNPVSVPEPGTLALFGIGLAAMGLSRRRKIA